MIDVHEKQEAAKEPGFLRSLREAIGGSHQDFTQVPIGRAVMLLAVPMVLETCMESVFAVVDIFFVSRLGAAPIAAVGLTEAMMTLIYAVAIGLSMGAAAVVARRIGEKDQEGAAVAAVQSIAIGWLVAIPVGLLGGFLAPHLLALMGASQEVIKNSHYTSVLLAGSATVMSLFLINAIFRGAGDAAIAMRVLWFANALNIVLGPCLIFGLGPFPRLGVTGAAVATTFGRGMGVVYQLTQLGRKKGRIRITRAQLRLNFPVLFSILKISGTGMVQSLIGMTSWIGLIRVLSSFGSNAVAGFTIAIRIIMFALLPSWGMSNAAATLVGQNLGAKRPDRAEKSAWITCRYNLVFLCSIGMIFAFFAEHLIAIFTHDPQVTPFAVNCLRIVSLGFPFYAYGMVLTQAFNGAGDTFTPTLINLFSFWLWELPIAFVLSRQFHFGPQGVFIAITIAFSTLALLSAILFKRGGWKLRKV